MNDKVDDQQHVIELDDFEENANKAEADAENSADVETNTDDQADVDATDDKDQDVDQSKDGADTDGGDDAGESSVGETDTDDSGDDEAKANQQKIDKIVSSRLKQQSAKHQLELEQERQERARIQKQLDDINAHNQSEAQRQKELNEAIQGDNLADQKVKDLAQPTEFQAPVHAVGVQRFAVSDPDTLQINASELDIKMREQWGESYQINAMKIAHAMKQNVLHHDILTLANQHENGTLLLNEILSNDSVYNELALAGYQSKDFSEYSLKFNELASNLKSNGGDKGNSTVKKAKPQPNKTLKPAPSTNNTIDDEVIYID